MARRLFMTAAALVVAAAVVAGSAAAAGGRAGLVTVVAHESLFTGTASFEASGGIFGAGTTGTFQANVTQQPITGTSWVITRGTDTLTSSTGSVTWSLIGLCQTAAFPVIDCNGLWSVSSATGAYAGARGAGTFHGVLNLATGVGTDTFKGVIVSGN
jgi:hypothetical protein